MIHELKQPTSSVLAIDCPFPEARAIIEGSNPGWVFADDLNTPRAALVWAQGWVYTLKPTKHESVMQFQAVGDCELQRVDQRLLVDLSAGNKEFLFSKLIQFWGSVDAFLNTGLGYVLVDGEEIT